jgi:hypothetical protein
VPPQEWNVLKSNSSLTKHQQILSTWTNNTVVKKTLSKHKAYKSKIKPIRFYCVISNSSLFTFQTVDYVEAVHE